MHLMKIVVRLHWHFSSFRLTISVGFDPAAENITSLDKNRGAGSWYTIYHHVPVVKGINKPLY
jgi:hypothetical protein